MTYVGTVRADNQVDIVPRVSGTIMKVTFKEGSIVNEGDVLYELDNPFYQINVRKKQAVVRQVEAELSMARMALEATGSVTENQVHLKKAQLTVELQEAKLDEAKADLELALLELSYTQIRAPLTGRIGFSQYSKGTYVTPKQGTLATIMQLAPMVVDLSITESAYKKYLDSKGNFDTNAFGNIRIFTGNDTPIDGKVAIDSINNVIDSKTGTIRMKLQFENHDQNILPGSFVKVNVSK